jgi:hypothetical protein
VRPRGVPPRPTQQQLHLAYNAGRDRARADAQAGGPVPDAATVRARAARTYADAELQGAWCDGWLVAASELSR